MSNANTTLREVMEISLDVVTDAAPMVTLMTVMGILRSIKQREMSTYEGELASSLAWVKIYGDPTAESLRRWMREHLAPVADLPLEVDFVRAYLNQGKRDREAEAA